MTIKPQRQPIIQGSKIKKPLAFLLCLFVVGLGYGQNLIGNPSFEDTVACPTNTGSVDFAVGWSNAGDSPDYYHPCATAPDFSVPNNWGGISNQHLE